MPTSEKRVRTIGILGNYGNNNIGDEAILMGIISQLARKHPYIHIVIFSMSPLESQQRYGMESFPSIFRLPRAVSPTALGSESQVRGGVISGSLHKLKISLRRYGMMRSVRHYMVYLDTVAMHPKFWLETYYRLRDLDLLLIGGGNLLMDMFDRVPPLYAMHAILARLAGAKVMYYSVGAGPISTRFGRLFIKIATACADHITLRDQESREVLESIGVKTPMTVAADPALELRSYPLTKQQSGHWRAILKGDNVIGVSAVPFLDHRYWPRPDRKGYEVYIAQMAAVVDSIVEDLNYHVVLFPTKFPADVYACRDIYGLLGHSEKVVVIEENLDPIDLVGVIENMTCVVGTRLHSIILSLVASVPVVAISYHGKVESLMRRIGQDDVVIPFDELESSVVCEKLRTLLRDYQNRRLALKRQALELQQIGRRSADIAFGIMTRQESGLRRDT